MVPPERPRNTPADPARFFDLLATGYQRRYQGQNRFHAYFFQERMEKATHGMDLGNAHVLDIGSGTGELYSLLSARFPNLRFLASDVSAGMLARSSVPTNQQLHGHIYEHDLGDVRFDAIFMLGVTTYMARDELEKNLAVAAKHLAPQGSFIVTFTNAHAIDTWTRALVRPLVSSGNVGQHVLSSSLRIHSYGYQSITSLLEKHFCILSSEGLNHTVFPFNRLLPGMSVALAKQISRFQGTPAWLRFLSSDLLIRAIRK